MIKLQNEIKYDSIAGYPVYDYDVARHSTPRKSIHGKKIGTVTIKNPVPGIFTVTIYKYPRKVKGTQIGVYDTLDRAKSAALAVFK